MKQLGPTYLANGEPENAGIEYARRGIGCRLDRKDEGLVPLHTVVINLPSKEKR